MDGKVWSRQLAINFYLAAAREAVLDAGGEAGDSKVLNARKRRNSGKVRHRGSRQVQELELAKITNGTHVSDRGAGYIERFQKWEVGNGAKV